MVQTQFNKGERTGWEGDRRGYLVCFLFFLRGQNAVWTKYKKREKHGCGTTFCPTKTFIYSTRFSFNFQWPPFTRFFRDTPRLSAPFHFLSFRLGHDHGFHQTYLSFIKQGGFFFIVPWRKAKSTPLRKEDASFSLFVNRSTRTWPQFQK